MQTTISNFNKISYERVILLLTKWPVSLGILLLLFLINNGIAQEPTGSNLSLNGLPLQINFNESESKTYTFDEPIINVLSRNPGIVSIAVNGNDVTLTGIKAGRTGLKITSSSNDHYYIGLRINKPDGTIPGLPQHLSIGSVSEDSNEDLNFWKDVDTDLTGKTMDIRYIYINGGPINGWRSWGPERVIKYAKESLRFGLIPFFVYYNIPDGAESYTRDMEHVRSVDYMNAYFEDIDIFMNQAEEQLNGDLYGVILEPDFLGYIQQNAELHEGTNDPNLISTAVSNTSIAENSGTIRTLVERINKTINDKRRDGHKIFFGWQLNLWAYAPLSGSKGVLRRTDDNDLGWTQGRAAIQEAAEKTTQYAIDAGILSHGADFISIDKYGLDAMGHSNQEDPSQSTWFFNNDHWMNYLHFVKNMHLTSQKPIVLWQLPVGKINGSQTISAYTNQLFPDLPNSSKKYEDSSTSFFFGDTFDAQTSLRLNHFSKNNANDTKLQVAGNQINWGDHFQEAKDAGVIVALFGAGVGASTDGIGNPPTDDYFWIQKVQSYYQNGPIPLDQEYGSGEFQCDNVCPPHIKFINPKKNGEVSQVTLEPLTITLEVTDSNSSISSVIVTIENQTFTASQNSNIYTVNWTPSAYGSYSLQAEATNSAGLSDIRQITFTVKDPNACNLPAWDAETTYNIKGTLVEHEGFVYESKWWTKGDIPGSTDQHSDPWKLIGSCSNPNQSPTVSFISPSHGDVIQQTNFEAINLSISADDSDGSISSVIFEIEGQSYQASGNNPYELNWTPTAYSNYTILATATDNDGAAASQSISITIDNPNVNLPPTINFIYPINNNVLYQETLSPVDFRVTVTDDNSVSSVDFIVNNQTLIPSSNGSEYTLIWTPPSFGSYNFVCTATDNNGAISSQQITFTVQLENVDCNADNWDSESIYTQGDKVNYNSIIYQAKWWTQGNIPGTEQWGPWEELSECNAGSTQNSRAKKKKSIKTDHVFKIFPNPIVNIAKFNFSLKERSYVSILIYDKKGKKIKSYQRDLKKGTHQIEINTSAFKSGLYLYKLITVEKVISGKILKK